MSNQIIEVRRTLESCPGEIGLSMSNCGLEIDEGMEEALKNGNNYSNHYGWEFCGTVWWDGHEFAERVMRHWSVVDEVKAPTLKKLMEKVNDKWGWE